MDRTPSGSSVGSTDSSEDSVPYAEMEAGSRQVLLKPPPPYDHKPGAARASRRVSSRSVAFAALCVSGMCIILVSAGIFLFVSCLRGAEKVRRHDRVCLPCQQVRPNPLANTPSPLVDLLEVFHDHDDGNDTEICCASSPAQYAALFKLILKRQEEVKKLADVLGPADRGPTVDGNGQHNFTVPPRAVSAHLVFKPPTDSTTGDVHPSVQRWKSAEESPMSHVRDGLTFDDHTIYVMTPGLYFVYCQILYNADMPLSSSLVSSYVVRHSLAYPASSGILLKTRHTLYDREADRHSSYVGGLVFLHKGDQLYVRVSLPQVVSHDDKGSFFGLFKVGD